MPCFRLEKMCVECRVLARDVREVRDVREQ